MSTLARLLSVFALVFTTTSLSAQPAKWSEADAEKLLANKNYQRYIERRTKVSETDAKAQSELAAWCTLADLPSEARAHQWVAVSLEPANVKYHQALGRKRRGNGLYLTDDELRDALADLRVAGKVNKEFAGKLLKLAPNIQRGKLDGLTALLQGFDEPLAIPTLERAGVQFGETAQQQVVYALGRMTHTEATDSLMRHALYGLSPAVRTHAADQLASRNPSYYIPRMAGWLTSEDSVDFDAPNMPAQGVGGRHAVVWYVAVGGETAVTAVGGTGDLAKASVEMQQARGGSPFDKRMTGRERNDRVAAALKEATGKDFGSDADKWTKWLSELTDSYLPDAANAPPPSVVTLPGSDSLRRVSFVPTGVDCFAAGTPVSTRRGLVAVEDLKVGDLLLSRDMDEGTVSFQPVLRRITRPPTKQVTVTIEGEEVTATLGHPFRVKDRKWVYARDLKPGDYVKCLSGYRKVDTVVELKPAQAFSIEVANFNTYYVGKKQVLVHDNTPVYDLELKASDVDSR
ncbi:MAG: polymorphic toxin-type HINT domain-containing protein [Armatimonadaceae bacterium]